MSTRPGGDRQPNSTAIDTSDRPPDDGPVLVPVLGEHVSESAVRVAAAFARSRGVDVVVVNAVVLPEQTPLELSDRLHTEHRDVTNDALRTSVEADAPVRGVVRPGRNAVAIVLNAVETHESSAVVVERPLGSDSAGRRSSRAVDRIASRADCDVIVLDGRHRPAGLSSVLALIVGGSHWKRTADVASAVATARGGTLDVVHVVETDSSEREHGRVRERLATQFGGPVGDEHLSTMRYPEDAAAIGERSANYDLTVIEGADEGWLRRFAFGSPSNAVREELRGPTLTVWSNSAGSSRKGKWAGFVTRVLQP